MTNVLKLGRLYAAAHADETSGPSALVVAVIAPEDLDVVLDVLEREGAGGYHVCEIQARRSGGAATEVYKGAVYRLRLSGRLRLEAPVPAAQAAGLMAAIVGAAVHSPLTQDDIFAIDLMMRGASAGVGPGG